MLFKQLAGTPIPQSLSLRDRRRAEITPLKIGGEPENFQVSSTQFQAGLKTPDSVFSPLSPHSGGSAGAAFMETRSTDVETLTLIQQRLINGEKPVSKTRLGAGEFGQVYLLKFDNGEVVAQKEFFNQVSAKSEMQRADATITAPHPNIAVYLPWQESAGNTCLLCHYLPYSFEEVGAKIYSGLRDPQRSKADKTLLSLTLIEVCVQVFSAIAYLNRHHLVHLDIRPANIRIASDGRVVLCDLGTLSKEGNKVTKGALAVMEPEVLAGEALSAATDMWSATRALLGLVTRLSKLPVFALPSDDQNMSLIFQVSRYAQGEDDQEVSEGLNAGEFARVRLTESFSGVPLATQVVETLAEGGLRPREARRSAEELQQKLLAELDIELEKYNQTERVGQPPVTRDMLILQVIGK
jgi:serine/threonine protein kinase